MANGATVEAVPMSVPLEDYLEMVRFFEFLGSCPTVIDAFGVCPGGLAVS